MSKETSDHGKKVTIASPDSSVDYAEQYIDRKITELENIIRRCRDDILEMANPSVAVFVDSGTTIVERDYEESPEDLDLIYDGDTDVDESDRPHTLADIRAVFKSMNEEGQPDSNGGAAYNEEQNCKDEAKTVVDELKMAIAEQIDGLNR